MKNLFALAALALSTTCAAPANAQAACGPHDALVSELTDGQWQEARIAVALFDDGAGSIIEFFVNAETGTWTAIITNPNGQACIVGAGTDWTPIAADVPGVDG